MLDKDRKFIERLQPDELAKAEELFEKWKAETEYKLELLGTSPKKKEFIESDLLIAESYLINFWTDPRTQGQYFGSLSGKFTSAFHYSDVGLEARYVVNQEDYLAGLCTHYCYAHRLDWLKEQLEFIDSENDNDPPSKEKDGKVATNAQQVLIMHYLLKAIPNFDPNYMQKANLIEKLTGRNHTNIYNAVRDPAYTKKREKRIKDLQYVRKVFEDLQLNQSIEMINKELKG